jgi:ferredoxin-NADP reductase
VETYRVRVTRKHPLAPGVMEIGLERPSDFQMQAGQKIRFHHRGLARDYTLINAPDEDQLVICAIQVPQGNFSPGLMQSPLGTVYEISKPFGYFTFQVSVRTAVFLATGTGIAPFVAFVRAGVRDFILLQGARSDEHLYYWSEMMAAARTYVPCLTRTAEDLQLVPETFQGRVTGYLETRLPVAGYDFYLCGSGAMVDAATRIIDRRFAGSLVYGESFF